MLRSLLSPLGFGESEEPSEVVEPVVLGVISFAGYFIFYGQNIYLARSLSREEFNDYNVGVSSLLLLAALAPLGLEKLALKVVPRHLHRNDLSGLRGFIRFAILVALAVSLLLTLTFDTVLGSVLRLDSLYGHLAIPLIVASLPLLAVFSVLMEVATASGAPILAAFLYRIIIPGLMLISNLLLARCLGLASGGTASSSFLVAWFVVTIAMCLLILRQVPSRTRDSRPAYRQTKWLSQAMPLLLHGLLLTAIAQSGVLVLELDPDHHEEASVFAIAMQTGAVIVLFATSANRFYLPRVSVLLKNGDAEGLGQLARTRLKVVGAICLLFAAVVILFGRVALRAHGAGFEDGYLATCIIAVGASISTTFSLSPFGLQFLGMNRYVLKCIAVATVASIAGCICLADEYGAIGAPSRTPCRCRRCTCGWPTSPSNCSTACSQLDLGSSERISARLSSLQAARRRSVGPAETAQTLPTSCGDYSS